MSIRLSANKLGGSGGMLSPGKFLKLGTLRSLLRPCLGQNTTRISVPVVSVAREVIEPSSSIAIENREASILSLLLWMLEDSKKFEEELTIIYMSQATMNRSERPFYNTRVS